jgi:hypothetical protein
MGGAGGIVGTDGRVLPERPHAYDVVPLPRDGDPMGRYHRRSTNATAAEDGHHCRSQGHSHSFHNLCKKTIL